LRSLQNLSGKRSSLWLGHVSVSKQETPRPLLTPGEILQLPRDEALVLVSGLPPIRARKLRFFEDGNFQARQLLAPSLADEAAADVPSPQYDAWAGQIRAPHARLEDSDTEPAATARDDDERPRMPERGRKKKPTDRQMDLPFASPDSTISAEAQQPPVQDDRALGHVVEFPGGVRL
jgi:type IV secretion system protein VirD4